jgi:hypothetical protein
MEDKKKLIEDVLQGEEIAFEPIPEEQDSPLAHPVVDRSQPAEPNSNEGRNSGEIDRVEENTTAKESPSDAPEQKIDEEPPLEPKTDKESDGEEFTIPIEHAGMMADSIIGTVNNTLLEVGGGYFVTIRKHKDFYDFEEVIQIIEEQNVKNIKRLKLDEEDKALIRPLLIHILRKKSATLSPEMQLLMVVLSILIKKAKIVMEIRAENEILVERIRDIIRNERAEYDNEKTQQQEFEDQEDKKRYDAQYEETPNFSGSKNNTGLPDEAIEVMD